MLLFQRPDLTKFLKIAKNLVSVHKEIHYSSN